MTRPPRFLLPLLVLVALGLILLATPAEALTDADILDLGRNGNTTEQVAEAPAEAPGPPSLIGMLGQLALALGVVFALMWLVLWAARKWLPRSVQPGRAGAIRIVANRPLGQRKNLVLVQAQGKMLLLGVTGQSIQTLTEFEPDGLDWDDAARKAGIESGDTDKPFEEALR